MPGSGPSVKLMWESPIHCVTKAELALLKSKLIELSGAVNSQFTVPSAEFPPVSSALSVPVTVELPSQIQVALALPVTLSGSSHRIWSSDDWPLIRSM